MSDSATAEIIPFPTRLAAASPEDSRLTRALADLSDAIAAQRIAMAAWKASLGDLRTVTQRLGTSVRTYHDSLGRLDVQVSALRTEARNLEHWADGVLTREG